MSRLIRFQASPNGRVRQRLQLAGQSASAYGLPQEVLHG